MQNVNTGRILHSRWDLPSYTGNVEGCQGNCCTSQESGTRGLIWLIGLDRVTGWILYRQILHHKMIGFDLLERCSGRISRNRWSFCWKLSQRFQNCIYNILQHWKLNTWKCVPSFWDWQYFKRKPRKFCSETIPHLLLNYKESGLWGGDFNCITKNIISKEYIFDI